MSSSNIPSLSEGLNNLVHRFDKFNGIADTETLSMSGETGRSCLALLRSLHHLALIQERELGAMRILVGDVKPQAEVGASKLSKSSNGKVVQFPRSSSTKPKLVKSPDSDPA
ncbi:hypothetical protein CQ054_05980 [Ochrobactrum sp. MYb29]|nr:hypothetical protein CQ054_05980 [Ochrobactrum sp. MYb29]